MWGTSMKELPEQYSLNSSDRKAMNGQPAQPGLDSQNGRDKTTRKGEPGLDKRDRTAQTTRTLQTEHDGQHVQQRHESGQDSSERTVSAGQLELDSQDSTARTGQPGQVSQRWYSQSQRLVIKPIVKLQFYQTVVFSYWFSVFLCWYSQSRGIKIQF